MKNKIPSGRFGASATIRRMLIVRGKTIFKKGLTMSVIFSLIFSSLTPLFGIQNIPHAQAAEIGYAPQVSTASTVVDGIGSAKNVSITSASPTSTDTSSAKILPSQSHVDESSGAFLWSLPITLPTGRAGATPSLTLSYDSRRNNVTGYIAKGWELDIPYIQRINKVGVDLMYDRPDFASSTQGELTKLVPMTPGSLNQSGIYGAKAGYGRYELRNDNSWSMTDTNGTTFVYGAIARDREQSLNNASNISMWYLSSITDTSGNKIEYFYEKDENGRVYPRSIVYGDGMYRVTFEYRTGIIDKLAYLLGTKTDYAAGVRAKADRQLQTIGVVAASETRLTYTLNSNNNDTNAGKTNISGINIAGTTNNTQNISENYSFSYAAAPVTDLSNYYGTPGYGSATTFESIALPTGFLTPSGYMYASPGTNNTWWQSSNGSTDVYKYSLIDLGGDGWKEEIIFTDSYNSMTGAHTYTANVYGINTAMTAYELKPSYALTLPPTGFTSQPTIQMADVDGDSKVDILYSTAVYNGYALTWSSTFYHNTGTGFVQDNSVVVPNDTSFTGNNMYLQDINSDGKADIIFTKPAPARVAVYLSTGTGFKLDPQYTVLGGKWPATIPGAIGMTQPQTTFRDVNGDNREDLIRGAEVFLNRKTYFDYSEGYSISGKILTIQGAFVDITGDNLPDIPEVTGFAGSSNVTYTGSGQPNPDTHGVLINTGMGFRYVPSESMPTDTADTSQYGQINSYPVKVGLSGCCQSGNINLGVFDMNSDGFLDGINANSSGPGTTLRIHPGTRENVMISITNPGGNTTNVTYGYEVLQNTNVYGTPLSQYVVKSVTDSTPPANTVTYSYTNGLQFTNPADLTTKFAGFATVTTTNTEGIKEISYYHQGNESNTALGEYQDSQYKIGREYRTETYTPSGTLAKTVITKWGSGDLGSGRALVFPEKVLTRYSLGGAYDTAIGYTYDTAYGQVIRVNDLGLVSGNNDGSFTDTGNDAQTTEYKYVSNGILVRQSLVTKKDSNNKVLSQSGAIYDNGVLTRGLPTEISNWIDGTTIAKTKYVYNTAGLPISVTDPLGNTTTTTYDAYTLYPASIKNALGQITNFNSYDYMAGKPTKVTDPKNLVMEYTYDAYGRESTAKRNAVAIRNSYYSPIQNYISYLETPPTYYSFADIINFDGLGRVTSSNSTKKGYIYYTYNTSGRKLTESIPSNSWGGAVGSITTYTYDALGRVLTATNSLGTTTTTYNGLTVSITNPNNITNQYQYNVRGNLLSVIENQTGTTPYTTNYTYNGNGHLTSLADADGNKREFAVNLRGNVLSATDLHTPTDPSYGMVKKTYDLMGNVTKIILQDNKTISTTFDSIGRPKVTTTASADGTVEETITNTYDTCTVTMLCSATSSLGVSTSYTYTPEGFIATKSQTIDGNTQTKTYTYDNQGQIMSITEPDGTVIAYDRNTPGANIDIVKVDGNNVVSNTTYDIESRIKQIMYPLSTPGSTMTTTYTYDPTHMLQLSNQKTTINAATTNLIDTTYTYDANNNITQAVEAGYTPLQSTKSYTYDAYDRLTGYTTTPATGAGTSPDSGTYNYSPTGSMTSVGSSTYSYGPLSLAPATSQKFAVNQQNENASALKVTEHSSTRTIFARLLAAINPFHAETAYAQAVVNCTLPQVLVPSTNTCAVPIICSAPATRNTYTNTCTTLIAPICTSPNVLVPSTNTCALPATCTTPTVLNIATNTCITPTLVCTPPQILNSSNTACINPPPPPMCPPPKVYSVTLNSCVVPPPVCTLPQVLVPSTNMCAVPVVCVAPQVIDPTTNTCKTVTLTLDDVKNFLKSKGFGSQQTGRAIIKAGYNKVTVFFKNAFSSLPLISAIPVSKSDAKYYLSDITSVSFRIRLFEPTTDPVSFNWNAVENPNDDGSVTESEDDSNTFDIADLTLSTTDNTALNNNPNSLYNEIPPINTSTAATSGFTSPQALTKATTPSGPIRYTYDARGNLTSESVPITISPNGQPVVVQSITTHQWNIANRLVKTTLPNGDIITYRYAPDGTRVMKKFTEYTVPGPGATKITTYMDGDYESENDGTNTITRSRIMLGSVNVATVEKNGATTSIYYQLTNPVGSSTITTDTAGTVIQAQDTKPYGGYRVNTDTLYVAPTPATSVASGTMGATGIKDYYALHERDIETGLTYMNARMYNETMPSFLSLDPASQYNPQSILQDPQQLNLYAYARGNPVRYNDPSGENLMDGPIERYNAFKDSISQGSWDPLRQSFNEQMQEIFPQLGDSQEVITSKTMNLALSFSGGGGANVSRSELVRLTEKFGPEMAPKVAQMTSTGAQAGLNLGDHAAYRMVQRRISIDAVKKTMAENIPVEYFHDGVLKNGFRDPATKIFVGQIKSTGAYAKITSVFSNTSKSYLSNIISKGKVLLSKIKK